MNEKNQPSPFILKGSHWKYDTNRKSFRNWWNVQLLVSFKEKRIFLWNHMSWYCLWIFHGSNTFLRSSLYNWEQIMIIIWRSDQFGALIQKFHFAKTISTGKSNWQTPIKRQHKNNNRIEFFLQFIALYWIFYELNWSNGFGDPFSKYFESDVYLILFILKNLGFVR